MRIKINRIFSYQESSQKVGKLQPGIYTAPKDISFDMCAKVLKFGNATLLADVKKPEKKAPENKVVKTPDSKAEVEVKSKYRRSAGSKSDE